MATPDGGVPLDPTLAWHTPDLVEALRQHMRDDPAGGVLESDDSVLSRFLIARKGHVEAAAKMLARHYRWRREDTPWWPAATPTIAEIQPCLDMGSSYIRGSDKAGRPIVHILAGKHDPAVGRVTLKKFIAFQIDELVTRSEAAHAGGGFSAVLDVHGFGYAHVDNEALKFTLNILSGNFPERLAALYVVREGWLFRMVWALVEHFIDARTRAKIHFLGGDYVDRLLADVAPDQLPVRLGGTDAYEYAPAHAMDHLSVRGKPWGALPLPVVGKGAGGAVEAQPVVGEGASS